MLEQAIEKAIAATPFIAENSSASKALAFFLYDGIKILFIMFSVITIAGLLRTYVPVNKLRAFAERKKQGWLANLAASLFGIVTPFCSCSSIPIFFGFLEAGMPLGASFSFLITSPIVNEYLIALMLGFFGWKITLAYVLVGIAIGTFSGIIIGKLKLESSIELKSFAAKGNNENKYKSFKQRLGFGFSEAVSILKRLWLWLLAGIAVGAIIHNFVPSSAIESAVSKTGFFAVPIVVALGVPMYGSCAAIVPIAVALFEKGVPIGTALAFMMSVSALSFPEAIILRKAMKLKLIAIFFGIVFCSIIVIGYLFNIFQQAII